MGVNQRSAVRMSPEEVDDFLRAERTTTMCTMHPDGSIHAVAMWYAFLDGTLAIETKRKSQKIQNLRRDPRLTFLVEAGDKYENLRGVELVGRARDRRGSRARLGVRGLDVGALRRARTARTSGRWSRP